MKLSSCKRSFEAIVKKANRVVAITGAGISAESGVPTFRGAGGFWRSYECQNLATPSAFRTHPSLVWEFYHYRRELVRQCTPNNGHIALAKFEAQMEEAGKEFLLVTQNVDGLHRRAGSKNIIELHGSLYRTKCTKCGNIEENRDSPICPALEGFGAPDRNTANANLDISDLPTCRESDCYGLLRPDIVWFGENLDWDHIDRAETTSRNSDLILVIGTSSVVYPAAMIAPNAAQNGVPVAEFNMEHTPHSGDFNFHFQGPAGTTLPDVLQIEI